MSCVGVRDPIRLKRKLGRRAPIIQPTISKTSKRVQINTQNDETINETTEQREDDELHQVYETETNGKQPKNHFE